MITTEQLEELLDNCIGTTCYIQPMLARFKLTEGASLFIDKTGAYDLPRQIQYLLDNELTQDQRDDWFKVIKVTKDYKLVIEDGNYNVLATADLSDHAEIPEHDWQFFFADDVLMVPSEY